MDKAQNEFCIMTTGYKGIQVLKKLKSKPKVVISYENGEGFYEDIKNWCSNHLVEFYRRDEVKLSALDVDYFFLVGWQYFVDLDKDTKVFVIHDSKLPESRGFCPTVSSLIQGRSTLAASCFIPQESNVGPDFGTVIDIRTKDIHYPIKLKEAFDIVSDLSAEIISSYTPNQPAINIDWEKSTFSVWRDENDFCIDWNESSDKIKRQIDATGYPYRGSTTHYDENMIRVMESSEWSDLFIEDRNKHIGKTWKLDDGCPVVICGKGLLKIEVALDESDQLIDFSKVRKRFR